MLGFSYSGADCCVLLALTMCGSCHHCHMGQYLTFSVQVEAVKKKMAKESAKAAESVIAAAKGDLEAEGGNSAPSSPAPPKRRNRPSNDGKLEPMEHTAQLDQPKTPARSASAQGMSKSKPRGLSRSGGMKSEAMGKEHKALMAEDQVQAMWRGQNERLLRLLEEEEVREAEREQSIKAVQYEMMERQRLEREVPTRRCRCHRIHFAACKTSHADTCMVTGVPYLSYYDINPVWLH